MKRRRTKKQSLTLPVIIMFILCICIGSSIFSLRQNLSNKTNGSNQITTPEPTTEASPTTEKTYQVEYYVDLDKNAFCTSDANNLDLLETIGIKLSYTDYSSGERELEHANRPGSGLPLSAFPWTYQFTLKKSAAKLGDYLHIDASTVYASKYTCHSFNCKILINGVEVRSDTSFQEIGHIDCSISISDLK